MSADTETHDRSFDPDALRDKYRSERDKRLRPDGNDQYVNVVGEYGHFLDDPFATSTVERQPLLDDVDVLIVGGGFGGLLAGACLRKPGVEEVRIIDNGSEFRGTW